MSCNKCGQCCEGIGLNATFKRVGEMHTEESKFIVRNWREISAEKFHKLNPFFDPRTFQSFYVCKKYDRKNKRCTVHGSRPNVCSDYPFYSLRARITGTHLHPECGYILQRSRIELANLLRLVKYKKEGERLPSKLLVGEVKYEEEELNA